MQPAIAVVTAERPRALDRCLRSLVQSPDAMAPDRVDVFDNSRSRASVEANRTVVSQVCGESGAEIRYIGCEAIAAAERLLKRVGWSDELIAFCLAPRSSVAIGANRNSVLLMHAGTQVIAIDDDVVGPICMPEDAVHGIDIASCEDPRVFRFGPYQAAGDGMEQWHGTLPEMYRHLGSTVAELTTLGRAQGDTVVWDPVIDWWRAEHRLTLEARIRVAMCGLCGDDTMGWPTRLLFMAGESRANLHSGEDVYRNAYMGGPSLRFARRATVSDRVSAMATCIGLDNQRLLPPFCPAGRGEDPLWAVLLGSADPHAVVLHVPQTVWHWRVDGRRRKQEDIWCHARATVTALLMSIVGNVRMQAGTDVGANLGALGEIIEAISSDTETAFREFCRGLWQERCGRLQHLAENTRAAYADSPEYWKADLTAYIATLAREVNAPGCGLPEDVVAQGDLDTGWRETQAAVKQFGRMVSAWESGWNAFLAERELGRALD